MSFNLMLPSAYKKTCDHVVAERSKRTQPSFRRSWWTKAGQELSCYTKGLFQGVPNLLLILLEKLQRHWLLHRWFFRNEKDYSEKLVQAAKELFAFAMIQDNMGIYTADEKCGAKAQMFYNSFGYYDELAWARVWLYFATGNDTYLTNATDMFKSAMQNELAADSRVIYWNNKLPAIAVLLSRLRYFHDPGFQYQDVLKTSSSIADKLMCSYLSLPHNFNITPRNFNITPGSVKP